MKTAAEQAADLEELIERLKKAATMMFTSSKRFLDTDEMKALSQVESAQVKAQAELARIRIKGAPIDLDASEDELAEQMLAWLRDRGRLP